MKPKFVVKQKAWKKLPCGHSVKYLFKDISNKNIEICGVCFKELKKQNIKELKEINAIPFKMYRRKADGYNRLLDENKALKKKNEEIFKLIDKLKIKNNIDVPSRLSYNNALENIEKKIKSKFGG